APNPLIIRKRSYNLNGTNSPLMAAILHGKIKVVELFLKRNISYTTPDNNGFLPLHLIFEKFIFPINHNMFLTKKDKRLIDRVLKPEGSINAQDGRGNTVLMNLAASRYAAISAQFVQDMVLKGADLSI